jgi:hypothetical protein
MDFRYLLYFERDARVDVLEHLATMASPTSEGPTTLVLPDRTVDLPFGTWSMPQRRLAWDDPEPSWEFMTVLCFPPDDPIEDYLDRLRTRQDGQEPSLYDDQGRAELGIVYLTVRNDLGPAASGTGEDLVLFDFGTPGSSMSVLFMESESIRATMVRLLESCRGVYGVFDREDEADLFWLRGSPRDDTLPTAELSLAEIEALVAPTPAADGPAVPVAPLPFSFAAEQVVAAARHVRRTGRGTELGVHHWLVALHEDDGNPPAASQQALAHGDIGSPLSEDQVRDRAILRARQAGRTLVSTQDVAAVVAEAARLD